MISSLILPLLRDNWSSSSYGPAFTLFLVATVGYAIVKHRLFDVKLIIARSLGYVGALTVLSTLYGLVILGVARFGFGLHFSLGATIFLSIATGLSGFTFHRLQTSFNKTTNKLFYRDAYDPQTFLDEFNKVLVAIYDLKPLLQESTKIISENLKPEYAVFEINKTATTPQKVISSPKSPHLNKEDMSFIRASVLKMRQKLIVTDDLDSKHSALQRKLGDTNISVVVRITSSLGNEGVGYLFLGPKKTGNPYSSQDVAVLEIVANELVIAIQNALRFEEIASFNITLQGKVNEATGKLRRANEKLKTLDETKDDFISMASHQLRTPLTSIKGYVSMVMEGDAGKLTPTQKEMLSQAFLSSQRMVYLIADLLNVSRLKTGKFIVEPAKVSLPKVIEEELSQLQKTAAGHKLKLVYSKPKDFPDLMLDETKIRQVIMNFIDNAIYYSKSGGEINIKLIDKPNTIELRVEDSGIGVPKSDQPHLFTKFYRAGNARKARPDGTGLGLFMAKKVIAAQGGALIFESQEGKGSTFGFMFNKAHLKPVSDAPNPKPAEPAIKLTHRNQ